MARNEYLKFIADGISQRRRDELVGGGVKRSRARLPDIDSEPESYDERVLGGGSFVDQLRREEELQERLYSGMTLSELIDRVEKYFHTEPGQLDRRSRDPIHQKTRDIFCAIAVKSLGHSDTEAGRILNIRRSAVSHAVRRGNLLLAETPSLKNEFSARPQVD